MSQLPLLRHDELDEAGQQVWEAVVSTRGQRVVSPEGHLTGPFNALLHAPVAGLRVSDLGAALRFHSSLEPRLLELAVLTVAARWQAEYEWVAHAKLAAQVGLSEEVVDALAERKDPPLEDEDQRTVYTVARQVVDTGHIEPAAWAAANKLLGNRGLVELVFLCGYYSLVSFGLNAFDVPLLPGDSPRWPA
ncbi:MAG: carboxymuconolactone decarboxylase family protein [Acidimicrobiales bacterium]|nr:carboxymuconolactone decarboxylase family protein [Acidimicrobiales bacterium]